jgi:hydrogenase small subunit
MAAIMGLPYSMHTKVAEAATADDRPPVIWLHFQECTGCSESLLRSDHPAPAALILDMISLDYHETLMAGSGEQAEHSLEASMKDNWGKYILVVEGAVPMKDGGIYCKVAGKKSVDALSEAAEGAAAVICVGTCASYGGVQAAAPNPTGAVGASTLVTDKPVINVPGCPPSPYNLLATILYYLTFNKIPKLDEQKRPLFAYGRRIHEHCERRPHFDAGRFAEEFGDESHAAGHCLYKLGCKGPVTFANCSVQRFNDIGVWPVSAGHPCIGCTEPDVVFNTSIYDKVQIHEVTPPDFYPTTKPEKRGKGADPLTTGVIGGVFGAAVGASAMMAKKLPQEDGNEEDEA